MIEEIIYTSAPKGLKAGSRGFCTVVSTAGMALNTAERLESMSGYRHAFPMQDPRAPLNPVSYSHVTLRIGGRNVHVISRVADAGQDYSGRTNKLAHHLVIDDVSRFIAGSVRLMAETGVLVSHWDGNTRNVPPRKLPSPAIPQSIELQAWKSVTGDSGWAGWVAEQLTKDKTPVSVIFAAGTDTFSLVREILDLLPPAQRWSITFSTYFTKLLAGTECQLRFVLDDTPEATALRNDARARVVDLTFTLKPATGGPIVTQARGGRIVAIDSLPPVQRQSAASGRPAASSRVEQAPLVKDLGIEIPALRSPLPDMPESQSPALPPTIANPFTFNQERPTKKRSSGWWKYVVGAILLVASSSLITVFVLRYMNEQRAVLKVEEPKKVTSPQVATNSKDPKPETVPPDVRNATSEGISKSVPVSTTPVSNDAPGSNAEESAVVPKPADPDPLIDEKKSSDVASTGEAPRDSPPESKSVDALKPSELAGNFRDRFGQILFSIPMPTGQESEPEVFPLALAGSEQIKISALRAFFDAIDPAHGLNGLDIAYVKDPQSSKWTVEARQGDLPSTVLADLTIHPVTESQCSATHELTFIWRKEAADKNNLPAAAVARWCPIQLQIENKSSYILLRKAEEYEPPSSKALLMEGEGTITQSTKHPQEFGLLACNSFKTVRARLTIATGPKQQTAGVFQTGMNSSYDFLNLDSAAPEKQIDSLATDITNFLQMTGSLVAKPDHGMTFEFKIEPRLKFRILTLVQVKDNFETLIRPFGIYTANEGEIANRRATLEMAVSASDTKLWKTLRLERTPQNANDTRKRNPQITSDVKNQIAEIKKIEKTITDLEAEAKKVDQAFQNREKAAAKKTEPEPTPDERKNATFWKTLANQVGELRPLLSRLAEQTSDENLNRLEVELDRWTELFENANLAIDYYVALPIPGESRDLEVHFFNSKRRPSR